MYIYKRFYSPVKLFFVLLIFFSIPSHAQLKKSFVSSDIFQTNYFIENKGQFNKYGNEKSNVLFAIENNGEHIYFRQSGLVWHLSKRNRSEQVESDEENKNEEEREEEERENSKLIETDVTLQWINSNPDCIIQPEEISAHYFTYGEAKYNSHGYKKITYLNLYPLIDVTYIIPDEGGIKYSLILHEGADLSKVAFKYSGDKVKVDLKGDSLFIHNKICDLAERRLTVYYEDGTPIQCQFHTEKNIVSFQFNEVIDHSRKIIVDPWVSPITTLTVTLGGGNNKGYDVDFDYQGNLYVYGGGYLSYSLLEQNEKIAKYSTNGTLLWTFSGTIVTPSWESKGGIGAMGNFVVEKLSGKIYVGQGANLNGAIIVRLNTNGVYDNFISPANANFNEIWEMNLDCTNGNILGMGGGTQGNINMGVITTAGAFSSANVTGFASAYQDIASSTITNDGELFVLMASVSTWQLDNSILKLLPTLNGNYWIAPTGFYSLAEADNKPFVGYGCSNGINALHANSQYLFYYDGYNIAAYDKNTGALVGTSDSIPGYTLKFQGGIYADECNNIYAGGNNGNLKVFHFNGIQFTPLPDIVLPGMGGKHIYDIKYNSGNDLLYISGEELVATATRNQVCIDTSLQVSLFNDCSMSVVNILNGDPNAQYTFIWTDSTSNIVLQTNANLSTFSDTLNSFIAGHVIHVLVVKNALCGGANKEVSFIASNQFQLVANPTICFGQSYVMNGHTYSVTGVYLDTLLNASGCDTIVTTSLTVLPVLNSSQNITICNGQNFIINGHSYNTTGTYQDTLLNAFGCDSVVTTQLIVSPISNVNLGNDTVLCNSQSVTLDAANAGQTYLWNTNASTQTITVNTAGIYWVQVGNGNCIVTDSIQISSSTSILNLGNDTVICSGQTVTLNAGNAGSTYLWSTAATTQIINVNAAGNYTVTVTNVCGIQNDTIAVSFSTHPVLVFGNDTNFCSNFNLQLNAGNVGAVYLWNNGTNQQTLNVNAAGVYWVNISNSCGSVTDSIVFTQLSSPIISLGNDTLYCSAFNLVLNATNTGSNYLWSTGNTSSSININSSGTYWVNVSNTCGGATDTITITQSAPPVSLLGNDTVYCNSFAQVLDAGANATAYLWNDGTTNQTITVNQFGTYWVQLSNNCGTVTDTIHIYQAVPPSVNLGNDTSICGNFSMSYDVSCAGCNYLWSTNSTASQINLNTGGTVIVNVNNQCGNAGDTVIITAEPILYLTLQPDTTLCSSEWLALFANTNAENILWSTGDTSFTIYISENGTYWADATNSCSAAVDSIIVSPCPGEYIMPNAFSPNGDGINDLLFPVRIGNATLKEVSIYNRWGEQVFISSGGDFNWDGTYNDLPCSIGVYVYVVFYREFVDGREVMLKGNSTLIR